MKGMLHINITECSWCINNYKYQLFLAKLWFENIQHTTKTHYSTQLRYIVLSLIHYLDQNHGRYFSNKINECSSVGNTVPAK